MENGGETILETLNVTKSFGGIQAVRDVSFRLSRGYILGLIGPNGAGKTTLFNMLAGALKPSSGAIKFKGIAVTGLKPHKICHLGIARTFQIVKPFSTLSVLENVMIGAKFGRKNELFDRHGFRNPAMEVLEFIGIQDRARELCSSLNIGEIKKVELARAMATNPEVLLLDEVIAGLNPVETASMMELILRIRREKKVTVLMIEHVMKAVMGISDKVMVLNHGEKIAEGIPSEVINQEQVVSAYLGERMPLS